MLLRESRDSVVPTVVRRNPYRSFFPQPSLPFLSVPSRENESRSLQCSALVARRSLPKSLEKATLPYRTNLLPSFQTIKVPVMRLVSQQLDMHHASLVSRNEASLNALHFNVNASQRTRISNQGRNDAVNGQCTSCQEVSNIWLFFWVSKMRASDEEAMMKRKHLNEDDPGENRL